MIRRVLHTLVTIGFIAFLLVLGPAAFCQDKSESPAAEYKAVTFSTDEKESTKKLNDLAADGWEYVGPLGNSMIAFKRSRATVQQLAAKKELAKWEGSWEGDGDVKMTIKGDRFTSSAPGIGSRNGKLVVIEVREKLALVDFVVDEGDVKGQTAKAIVHLEDDILHSCVTFVEARPTDFQTADEHYHVAWKRARSNQPAPTAVAMNIGSGDARLVRSSVRATIQRRPRAARRGSPSAFRAHRPRPA